MERVGSTVIGVTGGTGFVGSRFVEMALSRGYVVRCLRRPSSGAQDGDGPGGPQFVPGDLTNVSTLYDFVQGVDHVVHLAAKVGYGSLAEYRAVNVQGSRNLCDAIARCNPTARLLHCSSIAVLRRYRTLPWLNTLYCRTKFAGEQEVRAAARDRGLAVSYVYPGLVYGPSDTKFIPTLARAVRAGKMIDLRGGERWAPLVYVDDLCDLLCYVLESPRASGRSYIGIGQDELGIQDLVRMIAHRIGADEPKIKLPKSVLMSVALILEGLARLSPGRHAPAISRRTADILSINFDPALVRQANRDEWRAGTSLATGLDKTLDWLRGPDS